MHFIRILMIDQKFDYKILKNFDTNLDSDQEKR